MVRRGLLVPRGRSLYLMPQLLAPRVRTAFLSLFQFSICRSVDLSIFRSVDPSIRRESLVSSQKSADFRLATFDF